MSTSACLLLLAFPSTPTTITVGVDGDYETFPAAIAFIESEDDPDGYVLAVESGTWVLDSSSCIDVNNLSGGLSIQPASSESTVILDGDNVTLPVSAHNVDLDISGVTIRNGTGSNGGGIRVSGGSLKLSEVIIESCAATFSGGGVYAGTSVSELEVTGCTFQDCTAVTYGGGIYVTSSVQLTVVDSTFTTCQCEDNGGGISRGGGTSVSSTTLLNTTFESCTARAGGGLFAWGVVQLTDCDFTSCQAIGTYGGGLYTGAESEVSLSGCTFMSNTADQHGGAISTAKDGTVDVQWCQFSLNTAGSSGGACRCTGSDATFANCDFSMNATSGDGGALALKQTSVSTPIVFSVESCSFDGNEAASNGGAICFGDWASGNGGYAATIDESQFMDNSASRGGGMYVSAIDPSSVAIDSCTMSGNASTSTWVHDAVESSGDVTGSITNVEACDHRAGREIHEDFVDNGGNNTGDWCCPGDADADSDVDADDIALLLTSWGTDGDGDDREDVDRDGDVAMLDLIEILRHWGTCD